MTSLKSRFSTLAQAVKEATATPTPVSDSADAVNRAPFVGLHKPAVTLGAISEALRDRVTRLEAELASASSANAGLREDLDRARALSARAGDAIDDFLFLSVDQITDRLPRDRLRGRSEGRQFDELLTDIKQNGQNDAITVRRVADGTFEIAAGRRRMEVCRRLGRSVLARVRELDDQAMLRVQFSENERRADISALERARWFADVRERLQSSAKEIAAQFGIDPSTFSLYLRLSRFPQEIVDRLDEPQRLAVLPARRVMEAIESDPTLVRRIIDALGTASDPANQIEILLRIAEGREVSYGTVRKPVLDRRHIVHEGRRIGTLTRNGGQWIFRFATSVPDSEVLALAERLAVPLEPRG